MKAKQEDKSNPGATKLFQMENQVIIYNLTKIVIIYTIIEIVIIYTLIQK